MHLIVQFFKSHTLEFDGFTEISGVDIKYALSFELNVPSSLLKLSKDGKFFEDTSTITNNGCVLRASLSGGLQGGKGGFGAMLRQMAKQSGGKKTTDFGSCRDLNGRRLRHVNDDIILQKWREAKDRGEEFDPEEETASGVNMWFLKTPSWAEGFKPSKQKAFLKPRRKTQICLDWQKAHCGNRHVPQGAPSWYGCPRGNKCEFAHGDEDLAGAALESVKKRKQEEENNQLDSKKESYMSSVILERDESEISDMVVAGLNAAKRSRSHPNDIYSSSPSKINADSSFEDLQILNPYEISGTHDNGLHQDRYIIDSDIISSKESSEISCLHSNRDLDMRSIVNVLSGTVDCFADGEVSGVNCFSTLCINGCSLQSGKWYYEVELLSGGLMQIGFANDKFVKEYVANSENGVGDDLHSWAYDGNRKRKWNNGSTDYGLLWSTGDFVGCLIDIQPKVFTISFLLNGKELGDAFTDISHCQKGLLSVSKVQRKGKEYPQSSDGENIEERLEDILSFHPAMSMESNEAVVINIGQHAFKYPPVNMHRPLIESMDFSSQHEISTEKFASTSDFKRISKVLEPNPFEIASDLSTCQPRNGTFDVIILEGHPDALSLEMLGMAHLKAELERRGLKAGGTLQVLRASKHRLRIS